MELSGGWGEGEWDTCKLIAEKNRLREWSYLYSYVHILRYTRSSSHTNLTGWTNMAIECGWWFSSRLTFGVCNIHKGIVQKQICLQTNANCSVCLVTWFPSTTDEVASRAGAVKAGKGAFIIYIKYNVFGSYMATRVL